ncbi:hypothetical protein QWZ06_24795 [Chryseobacterium tructae]|nr:hypothetical protein [Chryseobacterium tructae]MDN3695219.1 hypothetical protein [Chryseobacterium tructae]
MNKDEILIKLTDIFRDELDNNEIVLTPELQQKILKNGIHFLIFS